MEDFRYEFTPKELYAFLFKKKICPSCNAALTRKKTYKVVQGRDLMHESIMFFRPAAQVKKYEYYYTCRNCGRTYGLNELSDGWKE